MEELSKEELQSVIISLEKELFVKSRNAEIHNHYDETLCKTKTAVDKLRKRLGELS